MSMTCSSKGFTLRYKLVNNMLSFSKSELHTLVWESHQTGSSPLWLLGKLAVDLFYRPLSWFRENGRGGVPCAKCVMMIHVEACALERHKEAFVRHLEASSHPLEDMKKYCTRCAELDCLQNTRLFMTLKSIYILSCFMHLGKE